MKNILVMIAANLPLLCFTQIGINTQSPQKTLHVNGSLQLTNELSIGGDGSTPGKSGMTGQVLTSSGPGAAPVWKTGSDSSLNLQPGDYGSVIAVDGVLTLAQEIKVQMSNDFTVNADAVAIPIGNLNFEIVDNKTRYSGTSTDNSFTIEATGAYEIHLSCQIEVQNVTNGSQIVIGVWDDTENHWVARTNDSVTGALQTQSLLTTINMDSTHTYSLRVAADINAGSSGGVGSAVIKKLSSGSTGSGPVTQIVIRRLK